MRFYLPDWLPPPPDQHGRKTCKSKFRLTSSAHGVRSSVFESRGCGGAGVRRYENRLSAEFSAERVTSSPPESGGEPEGRGGLKNGQCNNPRQSRAQTTPGEMTEPTFRPPLTPPNLGGEEVTLTSHGVRVSPRLPFMVLKLLHPAWLTGGSQRRRGRAICFG